MVQIHIQKIKMNCWDTLFKISPNGKMKIEKNASNQKMDATFNNQLF